MNPPLTLKSTIPLILIAKIARDTMATNGVVFALGKKNIDAQRDVMLSSIVSMPATGLKTNLFSLPCLPITPQELMQERSGLEFLFFQ